MSPEERSQHPRQEPFVFALAVTAYWFIGFSLMYGSAFWDGDLTTAKVALGTVL